MTTQMSDQTIEQWTQWANDRDGPVALTLRQTLIPVEQSDSVVFPPTYANIGYNVDILSDGTKVATIDSVGAQANRMEPLFADAPLSGLIPQIWIQYGEGKKCSILDIGHRLGDALIRCAGKPVNSQDDAKSLKTEAEEAFQQFLNDGDASGIARLAPTSLVFGVWDSRNTQAKLPRIVQAIIRAWDIEELKRSSQYNPPVEYAELEVFSEDEKKKASDGKSPLAKRGYGYHPATRQHGGIVVRGDIRRDVTINLTALRRLKGTTHEEEKNLRSYIFGLSLVAATTQLDEFLRQGCLLVPDPDSPGTWEQVRRDGTRETVPLQQDGALIFAEQAKQKFGVNDQPRTFEFSEALAKEDIKKAKSDTNKD